MKFNSKKIIFFSTLFFITLALVGAGCKKAPYAPPGVTLEWWGVWSEANQVEPLINAYRATRQNVTINYKKFRFEEFEKKLTEALAEDRGPDIISINNTWVQRYQNKILPLPEQPLTVAIGKIVKGNAGSTVVEYSSTSIPVLSLKLIKDAFVPVVYDDVVYQNKIYGLPLSVDSLALIYNRSVLAQSKITKAPSSWQEVLDSSRLVTLQDKDGKLTRSSIALGTANNIPRYFDILSLLMMQTGAQMTDLSGQAAFNLSANLNEKRVPAAEALEFYTNFANPNKESYTWNASEPNAVDAFASGELGMIIGYAYNLPQLKAKAPGLDIGIAPIPQLNSVNEVNYANYWVEAPLKKTKYPNEAWDFIQFISSDVTANTAFLDKTNRPPALRALIEKYKNDPEKGVFVLASLTAKNWYHGKNPAAAEDVFKDMINQVLDGKDTFDQAIIKAVPRINQTL